jgi:hypothetical protein
MTAKAQAQPDETSRTSTLRATRSQGKVNWQGRGIVLMSYNNYPTLTCVVDP